MRNWLTLLAALGAIAMLAGCGPQGPDPATNQAKPQTGEKAGEAVAQPLTD